LALVKKEEKLPQLTKTELAAVVEQFTTNIEDRLINPHITKAIEIGFENVLPPTLLTALVALNLTAGGNTELKAFYNNYFKQVWAYNAYIRFLKWHGNNVTQFGIATVNDDTTSNVSDKTRGILISSTERDYEVYLTRAQNRIIAKNNTFDGTSYAKLASIRKPKNKFGIRGI
jgi:hypothetical protein